MVDLSMTPVATDEDREAAELLKDGWFSPVRLFEWLPLGVPPPWDTNPFGSNTWDSWRHALNWAEPLVRVWLTDGDLECLDLMVEIICDWWVHNQEYPGASNYAWRDNPTSRRLERLMWFWEFYRTQAGEDFDRCFARHLLEIIQVHTQYNNNDDFYDPDSNHGLMLNTVLLEALAMMPEYHGSATWRETLERRMPTYIEDNFTALGYYREQTPSYHKYAISRLAPMAKLLRVYNLDPIPPIDETARTAASLCPFLARQTGVMANIGDSACSAIRNYWARWADWWGEDMPSIAPDIIPNPRDDQSHFMVDFDVGYAVFTAGELYLSSDDPGPDTFLLFRCNSTPYTHTHSDALSFMFFGMGHDWLIDSGGPYSYQTVPERLYVASYRAHNVVVVDDADSEFELVEPLAYDRTVDGDFVESRHIMASADHVRRVTFVPPYSMELHDVVTSSDGEPHVYSQILHVTNDKQIDFVSDTLVELTAPDGKRCIIEQVGAEGVWNVVVGQTVPYWQGWRTPQFEVIEEAPALYFSTTEPVMDVEFITQVRLEEHQCAGDLDRDGHIGPGDLAILLSNYGMTNDATYNDGDLDGDGSVTLHDLAALLAVYDMTCE